MFTVTGVLLLVYALGYLTSAYIFYAFGDDVLWNFYMEMQQTNTGLLFKAIVAIVFSLAMFALQLNKHAAGLYTLIVVLLVSAASVLLSVHSLSAILAMRQGYALLDLSVLDVYVELGSIAYRESTIVFELGIIGHTLFALSALFMAATVTGNAVSVKEVSVQEIKAEGGRP